MTDTGGDKPGAVLARYEQQLSLGEIEPDAAQRSVAGRLDRLAAALSRANSPRGLLDSLLRRGGDERPKGLYIHGAVGRGKTMLMDLFFDEVPVDAQAARAFPRVHGRRARAHRRRACAC